MIGYYIYLLIFFVSWHCIQCNRNSRGVVSIPQLFPFQKERSGEITFKTQGHHISALASTTKFVYTFYYGSSSCESDEEFYFYAIALDTCLQIVGQPSSLKVTISDYGDITYNNYDNKFCNSTRLTKHVMNNVGTCLKYSNNIYYASFQSVSSKYLIPSNDAFFSFEYYGDDACTKEVELEGYLNNICVSKYDDSQSRTSSRFSFPNILTYQALGCKGSSSQFVVSQYCDHYDGAYYYSAPSATHYASFLSSTTTSIPTVTPTPAFTAPTILPTYTATTPSCIPTTIPTFGKVSISAGTPSIAPSLSFRPTMKTKTSVPSISPTTPPQAYGIQVDVYQTLIGITNAEFSLSIDQSFGVLQKTVIKLIKPSKVTFGYNVYYVTRKDLPGFDRLNITYQIQIENEDTLSRTSAFTVCANVTKTLLNAVKQHRFNAVLASYALTDSTAMRGVTSNIISFSKCDFVTPESSSSSGTATNTNIVATVGIVLGTLLFIFMILFMVLTCWFTRKTLFLGIERWDDYWSRSRRYFPMFHPHRIAVAEATIVTNATTNANATTITNTTIAIVSLPVAEVISAEPLRRNRFTGSSLPSAAAVNVPSNVVVVVVVAAGEVELV